MTLVNFNSPVWWFISAAKFAGFIIVFGVGLRNEKFGSKGTGIGFNGGL